MNEFQRILLRQFKIDLTEKDKDFTKSFSKLKYNYDYSDICYIVDNLDKNNKAYNNLIYGCSTPKSISELGDTKTLFSESDDELFKEINWSLVAIRKYQLEINSFIKKRTNYEKAFLIGDYELANSFLDEIENEICISLWSIEQRFLLLEIEKGLKENTNYLTKINKDNKKWFIKYFSHFFSLKSEKELSVNQYKMTLARLLFKYYEDKNHVDLEYYNFKLNFLEEGSLKYLPVFLTFEGYHSIIDRYISLIRILQLEIISEKENKNKYQLDSRIYYLSKKINDPIIDRLRISIDTTFEWDCSLKISDYQAIKGLDYYTEGEFNKAELHLKKCIEDEPQSIELYEIYIKTLIIQNKSFETIGKNKDSFQNKILNCLYILFDKSIDISESLNEIRKIAYNLSSFQSLSYFLMDYYNLELNSGKKLVPLSIINTNFLNPTFLKLFSENDNYGILKNKVGSSAALKYIELLESNDIQEIENSNITAFRKKVLKAKIYQKTEKFIEAITEWEGLLKNKNLKAFQKEAILMNLFICKEAIKEFDYCIDLFVDNYFINPLLVKNILVDNLKLSIKKERFKSVKYTINLPLFYKLTNSDDYEIHTSYECFIMNQNCFTPSELIQKEVDFPLNKYFTFLDSVCTLDIFKHSPFITSSNQKLNERILICKYLLQNNNEKQIDYSNEIERLTKKQIIQKGIQEIDESKIYVNQNGIIDSELKNIQSIFNRFKTIGALNSESDISILSMYSDKVLSFKYSDEKDVNEFSKDPQFDIFKDIFHYLLDRFLFSNYGLQQYLSARIRHGVLLGEIRPEFEILNLITEIEKGIDKYKDNENWNIFIGDLNKEQYSQFQNVFSTFSSRVDTLINDEILSKYLQIKIDDKNPNGWLDYTFEDFMLQIYYLPLKDTKNIEEFLNSIFDVLWKKTETNLTKVRQNINEDIKEEFLKILFDLEQGLTEVLRNIPQQLFNNITEARVNIENKLNKIANWFSITDSNISDFKISKIIDVSLEYSQQSNINKKIVPKLEIGCNCKFKGTFYPSLVDLFRIFLDNTLKHSGFEDGEIKLDIIIEEEKDKLNILIKNPLSESINIDDLKLKISSFSLDLNQSMIEGRSGFHKAMRIIKSDLNSNSNDMNLLISDENEFCINMIIDKEKLLA